MFAFAERLLLNLRQIRMMSSSERRGAIKRRLGPRAVNYIRHFRAKREARRMQAIMLHQGKAAAHRELWTNFVAKRGWIAVWNHIETLAQEDPDTIDEFIAMGLRLNDNPLVLVNMAQYPFTGPALARAMIQERAAPWPEITKRMAARADYAAAFLVASAMTGDDAAIEHAYARIPDVVNETFLQFVESYGLRPAASASEVAPVIRGLKQSGLRDHKKHRLIIADTLAKPQDFLPLLCGADKVTLIGLNDTFGKAAFTEYQDYPGVGEIIVEHIRSRITRFSQKYIEIHSQTRDAAIEIAGIVDSAPDLVPEGDLPHLELTIADHLFFQVLRLRAVEELLADPEFDHVAVAIEKHVPASSYILTLSGVQGLTEDPRVELMSLAHSVVQRAAFSVFLPTLLTGPRSILFADAWLPSPLELSPQLWRYARVAAAKLPEHLFSKDTSEADAAPNSVLIATTSNGAYNASTAGYAAAVSQKFNTSFVICGGTAADLHRKLSETEAAIGSIPFHLLPSKHLPKQTVFSRWLKGKIGSYCANREHGDKVAHMILSTPDHLVTNVVQSHLLHAMMLETWFSQMTLTGNLPDMIVLSAARSPTVSQFTATARRHDVPTLTLEAHGLNANYCRYAKIGSDYYGVIAQKFRNDAVWGYDIDLDRTRAVGTPRIVAVPGRNHAEARAEIAEDLGHAFPLRSGGVISFFSQPSSWAHVSEVWRLILRAALDLDLQVLLKPHPEETATRVWQYQTIARELCAEDHVQLINSKPSVLIEASDVVLTGYSAAALDAAVMGRPIICITVGDTPYPLEQHEIARAPLVGDLDSLCRALRPFLKDPAASTAAYEAFRKAEPQFFEGPDRRLRDFVADIIDQPNIRMKTEVPEHLFLSPPHPVFPI